jgi:hypothetical protein
MGEVRGDDPTFPGHQRPAAERAKEADSAATLNLGDMHQVVLGIPTVS